MTGGKFGKICLLMGVWFLYEGMGVNPLLGQETSLVSDLIQGRKVFEEKNCSRCHSIFEERVKLGPKLQTSTFYGSFLDIFSILWNHAPAMALRMKKEGLPPIRFSPKELNQLISFLYLLPYLGEPGNPQRGAKLLREKGCLTCHSLAGRGKRDGIPLDSLAVYESDVVLVQRMWNHGPLMLGQMLASGTRIPTFSGNDLADLFAALAGQALSGQALAAGRAKVRMGRISLGVGDAARGQRLFEEKGCNRCHAIFGKGGTIGPDLGKAVQQSSVAELAGLLWNHVAGMQQKFRQMKLSWPYFSESEMSDLIVFLYSLSYTDRPGDPTRGEEMFHQKRCAHCHFQTEEHRRQIVRKVKSASELEFAVLLWNHLLTMETTMISRGVPWPHLTGAQLRDILAFLRNQ